MRQTFILKFLFLVSLYFVSTFSSYGQIQTKIQLMPGDSSWGVYYKHSGVPASPSDNTYLASAQVTIVAPTGFVFSGLQSVVGVWAQNARVDMPSENPGFDYISLGFPVGSNVTISDTSETLLFTFERVGDCPDTLYLIDNPTDPFNVLPNSAGNNPGNEFTMVDFATGGTYVWQENYALSAWSCGDCDGDGILDAHEDTNGDGNYDPISEDLNGNGIFDLPGEDLDGDGHFDILPDASDLCDPCDPIHPELAEIRGDTTMCASEDNTDIYVDITGGWPPYTVTYENDAGTDFVVSNYQSGDPINIVLTATDTFELVSIVDSTGCTVDSMAGQAVIVIEGILSITTEASPQSNCAGDGVVFSAVAATAGANGIMYNWQVSTAGAAGPYVDVVDGTPYSNATTPDLAISDVTGLNGNYYRLAIFTMTCDTVYSTGALLTEEGPITMTTHPLDHAVCSGDGTTFTAAATAPLGTLALQWQVSTDGGVTFTDLADAGVYSGVTTGTLAISDVAGLYDNQYRLAVSTGVCAREFSDAATLSVEGVLSIVDQPDDIFECSAQGLEFIVGVANSSTSANPGVINYQWQVSYDATTSWESLNNDGTYNGTKTDTLTADVSDSLNGTWYRAIIWTAECSYIISDSAQLAISDNATFDVEPQDFDICDGNSHTFTANATVSQGTFNYVWMVSTDGGTVWNDVLDGAGTGGAIYSGATTSDLTITDVSYLQNGFLYRVEARTADCVPSSSAQAVLNVEGPLSVTDFPVNDTVCRGDQAIFEAVIANPGFGTVEYTWQFRAAGSWFDLTNNSVYGGVNTPRLTFNTDQGGNDGDSIRLVVTTPTCVNLELPGVRLVIEGPVSFDDHPNDTTVCSGLPAFFEAIAANENDGIIEYRWQQSIDTLNYTDITDGGVFSGATTDRLAISDVTGRYDHRYRLKIKTEQCDWVYSEFATLTVEGPFSIDVGGQPQDVTLCQEGNAQFWVDVTNSGSGTVEYQWQIKDRITGTWENAIADDTITGATFDTISFAPISAFRSGDSIRVQITTGTCATDVSAAAVMLIEGAIDITQEPQPDTICSGGTANFDITYNIPNGGAGTPTLQWQVSTDGGLVWTDVTNSAPYSGANTTNLVITAPDHTYHNNRYRVGYTFATCPIDYTDDAVLFVEGAISFTSQPISVVSCNEQDVLFYVTTQNLGGGDIEYTWQVNEGSGWNDVIQGGVASYVGVNSDVMQIGEIDHTMNNFQYRVIIETGDCAQQISNVASLNVEGPLAFTNDPDDITVCSGGDTIMVVAFDNPGDGGLTNVSLQWEYSPNGIVWSPVPDDAVFDTPTDDTLIINDVAGLGGFYWRAAISTPTCPVIYSAVAELEVEGPIGLTDPIAVTDCNENSVRFTTVMTNPGAGVVSFQWEMNRGTGWVDLSNDTSQAAGFNGVRTDTLSVSDVNADSLNGATFRVRAWTSTCNAIVTGEAALTIEGPIEFADHPNDTIVCSGEAAFFEIAATNAQSGAINYQWQTSTNGVTWADIAEAGVFSGTQTNRLDISDVAGLYGHRYRCVISTTYCDEKFSDLARLTVEGPVIIDPLNGQTACRNEAYNFAVNVTNGGSGVMTYQWEVLDVTAGTWSDLNNDTWVHGTETTLLQLDSMDIMQTRGDTIFRLRVELPTCSPFFSDTALLHIVSDTLGFCDFDMDGEINDIDLDDDDDGLPDVWENSCLTYGQFNRDNDGDGDQDGEEDWDGDGISNHEETDGDGVLDGDPCDPCDPLISDACFGIALDIKVLLYGAAYDGLATVSPTMNDDLRQKGLIPMTEPYTNLEYQGLDPVTGTFGTVKPFKHYGPGGGETISDPAVLAVTGDDAIIDWVFVELRNANKVDSVVATQSALLQADGDVVDVDGVSPVTFDQSVMAGEQYVAVRHRNHLGVMTKEAPELSPDVRVIDFTDNSIARHGDHPQKVVDHGGTIGKKNYLWAGDLRPDGRAIYQGPNNDPLQIFLKVVSDPDNVGPNGDPNANFILSGYLEEDYDLNGTAIYQGPLNDRVMVLLQTVLTHPGNENILANYIVVEQLP